MKSFESRTKRLTVCRRELSRLGKLLASQETLSEARRRVAVFWACPDLALLLGEVCLELPKADCLAYEYDLFGDFSCDLVVGSAGLKEYAFIEFEDAEPDSVFKRVGPKRGATGRRASITATARSSTGSASCTTWRTRTNSRPASAPSPSSTAAFSSWAASSISSPASGGAWSGGASRFGWG